MSLKTWNEDILISYEHLWNFNKNIPRLEHVVEAIIEEKKGELIVDLLFYYKTHNMFDDYERIERGEILDEDFKEIGFDFSSLKSDVEEVLNKEGVAFIKGSDVVNSSKRLLFEYWEDRKDDRGKDQSSNGMFRR